MHLYILKINVLLLLCTFLIRIKINVRKSEKYAKIIKVIKSQICIRRGRIVVLYCIMTNNFQIFLFRLSLILLIIGIQSRNTRIDE